MKKDKFLFINIFGHSMKPFLKENDIAIAKCSNTFERGDIVVFRYGQNLHLIHRVLWFEDSGFYFCKGDNAFRIEKIHKNDILGKVIYAERNGSIFYLPIVNAKYISLSIAVGKEFIQGESAL